MLKFVATGFLWTMETRIEPRTTKSHPQNKLAERNKVKMIKPVEDSTKARQLCEEKCPQIHCRRLLPKGYCWQPPMATHNKVSISGSTHVHAGSIEESGSVTLIHSACSRSFLYHTSLNIATLWTPIGC